MGKESKERREMREGNEGEEEELNSWGVCGAFWFSFAVVVVFILERELAYVGT